MEAPAEREFRSSNRGKPEPRVDRKGTPRGDTPPQARKRLPPGPRPGSTCPGPEGPIPRFPGEPCHHAPGKPRRTLPCPWYRRPRSPGKHCSRFPRSPPCAMTRRRPPPSRNPGTYPCGPRRQRKIGRSSSPLPTPDPSPRDIAGRGIPSMHSDRPPWPRTSFPPGPDQSE